MIVAGLALLALGMVGLAIISRRSVSLRLLRALRDGIDPREMFDSGIEARVAELLRYGLARERDGQLAPTRFGRRMLWAARRLRTLVGVRR